MSDKQRRGLLFICIALVAWVALVCTCRGQTFTQVGSSGGAPGIAVSSGKGTNTTLAGSGTSSVINFTNIGGTVMAMNFVPGNSDSWIRWGGGSSVDGAEILWAYSHPQELQITSLRSISLNCGYGLGGVSGGILQLGSSGGFKDVILMQYDAQATSGSINGQGKPVLFATTAWTNGALNYLYPNFQAVSRAAASGDYGIEIYDGWNVNGNLPSYSGGWSKGSPMAYLGTLYNSFTNHTSIGGNQTNYGSLGLLLGGTAGMRLKLSSGHLAFRNAADNGDVDVYPANLVASGFVQTSTAGLLTANGEVRLNSTRIGVNSGMQHTWSSDATDANTGIDTGLKRNAAGVIKVTDGSTGLGGILCSNVVVSEPNGELWTSGAATELLTLATGAATTDTAANLLPANSVIEAVTTRVTTTITTAATFSVGDATTPARFSASAAGITSGSTRAGIDHWSGAVATLAAGPSQAAAAKVRITCNANPGAGVIRITVFYKTFTPPTQ